MSTNDTAKLYQFFGGQASEYQELRRSDDAKSGKERWPLLAWLDLSAQRVPDAPKVQVGEVAGKPATTPAVPAAMAPPTAATAPTAQAPKTAPAWLPGAAPPHAAAAAPQSPAGGAGPTISGTAPASGSALQQVFARIAQAQTSIQVQLSTQPPLPYPMPLTAPRSPLWSLLSKL